MSFIDPQALPQDLSFYGVGSALINDTYVGNCASIRFTCTLDLQPVTKLLADDPQHVWRVLHPKIALTLHDLTPLAQQMLSQGLAKASLDIRLHNLAADRPQHLQVLATCDLAPVDDLDLLDTYLGLALTCHCYQVPSFNFTSA